LTAPEVLAREVSYCKVRDTELPRDDPVGEVVVETLGDGISNDEGECGYLVTITLVGVSRDRFNVSRVTATTAMAYMTQLNVLSNRADILLVEVDMGLFGCFLAVADATIAFVFRSLPNPTACLVVNNDLRLALIPTGLEYQPGRIEVAQHQP
jgi:hypothetical protein